MSFTNLSDSPSVTHLWAFLCKTIWHRANEAGHLVCQGLILYAQYYLKIWLWFSAGGGVTQGVNKDCLSPLLTGGEYVAIVRKSSLWQPGCSLGRKCWVWLYPLTRHRYWGSMCSRPSHRMNRISGENQRERREWKRCVELWDGDPEIGLCHLLSRKRKWSVSYLSLDHNVMLFVLFLWRYRL